MNLRSRYDPPVPAVVLAEGAFGTPDGKTANGVVMHSEIFDVRAVIDSRWAESTVSDVLAKPGLDGVPVVGSTAEALDAATEASVFILGVAPAGGSLPDAWTDDIREAIAEGCDIVSGLHVFLSEDEEWSRLAIEHGVDIVDVRKPPDTDEMQVADGRATDVDADVVLSMGTDCASGKRTTTFELYRAAKREGIDAVWIATGQTGIMVGAHRGVVADRIPADFTAGAVEQMVCSLADSEMVFVEGQAAITHRAYGGVTLSILTGCWPDAVVLADDPDRSRREHFEQFAVPAPSEEIRYIEGLSEADVAAISTWGDPADAVEKYGWPAANVYTDGGPERLLSTVRATLEDTT